MKFKVISRAAPPGRRPPMPFCCDYALLEDKHIPQATGFTRFTRGGNLRDKGELAAPGPVYAGSVDNVPGIQVNTFLLCGGSENNRDLHLPRNMV